MEDNRSDNVNGNPFVFFFAFKGTKRIYQDE